ncbi:MAG: Stk1 family PASTA domain-containing Ser/Thr kinase [Actinobacteria bacterium]|nr:Stk1 family PASTA domain-containing Ser/Thr kinase [Actinomycetota bacterium]MCG2802713.1 Stk1 family PASTA domain-containing Ser/Thr kinase [Cellulomonas sp.]
MNEPNRILAGRYEVGEIIGRGGMAEVHIGYDRRLGRTVAIKVLRSDLARDPSFQNRFRREAQAAAALNHPAIVAVYDTGEESVTETTGAVSHVPYIVMEYVEGHTVRDILRDGSALPIDEALDITAGVLSALEYSHHAGIVHRDIKPANVMITPTGAIKVMDFGIARALADSAATMTQTQAVVGTAQYLSPEQARGEQVDARSDLYSTGCLLFELVTGRPPFMADSPVAIAYQHVREQPPLPSSLSDDVPEALDRVILKSLAKERESRYQTAAEFRADVEAVQRGGRVLAPAVGVPLPAAGEATTQLMAPTSPATQVLPPSQLPWGTTGAAAPDAPEDEDKPKSHKALLISLIAVGVLAVIAIVVLLLAQTRTSDAISVPTVAGQTASQAESALKNAGFIPERQEKASATVAKDTVIETNPAEGTKQPRGTKVTYFVSTGPATTTVPDVSGKTADQATAALLAAGLTVAENRGTDDNPNFLSGQVTKTDPAANAPATEGQPVTLYISTGNVVLTDVTGKSQADAVAALQALKLAPVVEQKESSTVAVGNVISTNPAAGTLLRQGQSVTVTVASAPSTAVIPQGLAGLSYDEAVSRLSQAGLTNVTKVTAASEVQAAGNVVSTSPAGGATVPLTQQITITVSTGAPAPTGPATTGPPQAPKP